jgi:hypothetical protein
VGTKQLAFHLKPDVAILNEAKKHLTVQEMVEVLTPEMIRRVINHAQLQIKINGKLIFDWFQLGDFKAFGG